MSFFQNGPVLSNLYQQDIFLKEELARNVPSDILRSYEPNLDSLGAKSATIYPKWQIEADNNPPVLKQYDPWGRRINEIKEAPYWQEFKNEAVNWGIVEIGHDLRNLGPHARIIQCAHMLLFSPTTANFLCPLAMSDAAACVLRSLAQDSVKSRLYGRLLSRDPIRAITSGQWMTERTGGSDVSKSETIAHFKEISVEEKKYKLFGVKWFTSSITSEMSLLLARVIENEKDQGLTLFLWEREDMPGATHEHQVKVLRLKDKLGTRALPTAEIELDGTLVTQIGEVGRGVANISEMLNITRFYNAVASAASMNYSSLLVSDYSKKRLAFGKNIESHALMREVLDNLHRESQKGTALCFELARLLGKYEFNIASENETLCMRALVPLSKLLLGKAAVAHASETLECFGGAGYIEDTGIPRILRDAQVFPIWEGTTNVLCLDLWRGETKAGAVTALIENLAQRTRNLSSKGINEAVEIEGKVAALNIRLQYLKSEGLGNTPSSLKSFAFQLGEALQTVLVLEHQINMPTI